MHGLMDGLSTPNVLQHMVDSVGIWQYIMVSVDSDIWVQYATRGRRWRRAVWGKRSGTACSVLPLFSFIIVNWDTLYICQKHPVSTTWLQLMILIMMWLIAMLLFCYPNIFEAREKDGETILLLRRKNFRSRLRMRCCYVSSLSELGNVFFKSLSQSAPCFRVLMCVAWQWQTECKASHLHVIGNWCTRWQGPFLSVTTHFNTANFTRLGVSAKYGKQRAPPC